MPTERIVFDLVESCVKVRRQMERGSYRKAASLACDGLKKLVYESPIFWQNLGPALEPLNNDPKMMLLVLARLAEFIELEAAILGELGIDDADANPILLEVFGSIDLAAQVPSYLAGDALEQLKPTVERATTLICQNSAGRIRRGFDMIFSKKGLRILCGAAVSAANMGVIHVPHIALPPLAPALLTLEGVLVAASSTVGGLIMGKEAKGVIDGFLPRA